MMTRFGTLIPPMHRSGQLLLAILVLALAQTGADAEIDRVSLEEALEEFFAEKRTLGPDAGFSVPLDDLVSKVPDMARVVLPHDAKVEGNIIKAIFAVKQPDGEVRDARTIRMKLIEDRTYGVARWSKRTFRSWLMKRLDDLVQGSVVLEDIAGLEAAGISFHLSVADVAEELLALSDPASDSPTGRALKRILGTSIIDGGFTDLEGGSRRFAQFKDRTLLLHIWATWCAPCIEEMPALEQLQDRYRDRGLTVVNLSDEPADVIRDWLSENGSTMLYGRVDGFEFLLGDASAEGVDRNLGVRPVYVVVDREGIVREARIGFVKTLDPGTMNAVPEGESEHHTTALVEPYL